ncbi:MULTISPECIES: response regulator transcription factor [Paenibacillus]|uniref:DNA-binding response regulator n=1 Tax=Paenibacillus odorifer TaxID=189426 RepID=A0A1R0XDC2_9BACL|nr:MULTISPECIES: response regulator transcription factor [Paenibacillus]MEC0130083.1 response regulator transcription factor [Paenibacillus odorifer]MEC0223068.1 response regulator transcription factor [Paenibacillus odorifer]OMD21141.1 DNA-binding response regulator [Paenibacillus odorifer]OMD33075.1 DNA-binding response regulator [Paenibacillus odorifer]OME26455.1 DNA-binding response regulator [Paenibacillus odorifer]
MANILIIDDEPDILALVNNILSKDHHRVTVKTSARHMPLNEYSTFDLILLDVMMPDIDGFELCTQIRDIVDCPILFLTAKSMETDIMFGLSVGADDYIVKPFRAGELKARVNAHLRRENRGKNHMLSASGVKFNLSAKEISIDKEKINLTKSEYQICEFLARNKGQVFSKEQIYESVYGYDRESDSSTITEHVKNIRSKLSAREVSPIETVWGIGYKWV